MKRLIFFVSILFSIGASAQEPTQEFLQKLDSLGATDSIAQAQMMYNKGVAQMEVHNYSEAITFFDQVFNYDNNFALAYLNRGICHMELGSSDKAIGDLKSGLEKDPKLHLAHYEMGVVYEKDNKSEDANVDGEILHKGISQRQFVRSFTIADDVRVNNAELKDGLLTISCERIIPEHKKKKLIEIK